MKEEGLKAAEKSTSKINQISKEGESNIKKYLFQVLGAAPYPLSVTGHQPPSAMTLPAFKTITQVLLKSCMQLPVKPS